MVVRGGGAGRRRGWWAEEVVVWAQREVGKTEERQVMEKVPTQEGWWVESR